jgi:hypothetical protein
VTPITAFCNLLLRCAGSRPGDDPGAGTTATSAELFCYRGTVKDGDTLECVFQAGEQKSANAVTREKAAEIAADFMATFYHVQVGALETQEFRTTPVSFWLICFSDTLKEPMRQMFFCPPAAGWNRGCAG